MKQEMEQTSVLINQLKRTKEDEMSKANSLKESQKKLQGQLD